MRLRYALALLLFPLAVLAQTTPPASDGSWHFVVAGDSRNCGDVVMPAIAEAASATSTWETVRPLNLGQKIVYGLLLTLVTFFVAWIVRCPLRKRVKGSSHI